MSAWKSVSTSAALVATAAIAAGAVAACTNGAGGGTAPAPVGIGYEKPTSPYEPSGGQEQPTNPGYQPPGGMPGGSSGGGGGGSCSYCGQTYTCSATYDGQTESSSTVTLPPAEGEACSITDDAGTASFSCAGTISFDGTSVTWTPTGNGGFTYTVSTTETVNPGGNGTPVTTTSSATVTCTHGAQGSSPPVSVNGEDAG
jgi:hypothetical protein